MPRQKKSYKTFHVSVPEEDDVVMQWLSAQYNQSASVRELIRAVARQVGMVDIFVGQAAERTPGVRGRAKQPSLISGGAIGAILGIENPRDAYTPDPERSAASEAVRLATQDVASANVRDDERGHADPSDRSALRPHPKAEPIESQARGPSRKKGIRLDARALSELSAPRRNRDDAQEDGSEARDDQKEIRDESKKEDTIKSLMDMMDM